MAAAEETGPNNGAIHRILLVEDNPGDRRLAAEMFVESGAGLELHVVSDGGEAISFLRREGRYSGAPAPDLILLDLNLPGRDGIEVLAEIRASDQWSGIPVIVLTSSRNEDDRSRSRALRADGFWNKPFDIDGYIGMARVLERFCRSWRLSA